MPQITVVHSSEIVPLNESEACYFLNPFGRYDLFIVINTIVHAQQSDFAISSADIQSPYPGVPSPINYSTKIHIWDIYILAFRNGERSLISPGIEEIALIKDIIHLSESERKPIPIVLPAILPLLFGILA